MPVPDYRVQTISRWVQYWLLTGEHEEDVRARFARRFPDLPETRYMSALRVARRAMAVGERVTQLDPDQQLAAALGRGRAPDPNVSVRVLATWTDASGHTYHNTLRISAQWEWTINDVMQQAQELLNAIANRYGGYATSEITIVPAVLLPSGEQL